MSHVIAVDLGAESGRVIKVSHEQGRLAIEEANRFPNVPVSVRGVLYWDVLRLWHDIEEGIAKAQAKALSVGVDTWGVDFALLDSQGALLSNPVHYRDSGKHGAMEWVFERVPRRTVFERTGIQFIVLNGLYQLAHMARSASPLIGQIGTAFTMAERAICAS
jgi:rhamnulokinase